ncbi:MAG: DNA repair protein RecO [Betaproteobacteria bacterium]|nr:MAG: DNA repair protein RecO [Betaproteobacteria bacterium]
MKKRADHEPGYVLHTYPYKETSLIVEAFTRRHGRVALLARGARRPRSAMRGVLLAFHPLRLGWSGSAELATLISAEWGGGLQVAFRPLSGRGLMCGFYLSELILRLLPREDPHEALFDAYAQALARLSAQDPFPAVLRSFEKRLLAELGYAPVFDRDASTGAPIEPAGSYIYEPDRGPVRASHGDLVISGRTLLDLAADDYSRSETRDEARYLMRALIGQRLHGQVLHTRSVLMELNEL